MARGRPPKPLKYHDLHGTMRADRHGKASDQYRPDGVPEKPSRLTGEADKFWDENVQKLIDDGVATSIDLPKLEAMCLFYAMFLKCFQKAIKLGDDDNRYSEMMRNYGFNFDRFSRIASEFGLDPAARTKLAIGTTRKESKIAVRNRA